MKLNFKKHSLLLPSFTKGMKSFELNGFSYSDCGSSCDTFNIIFIDEPAKFNPADFSNAVSYFNKKRFDFTVWIDTADLTVEISKLLSESGFTQTGTEPVMLLDLNNYTPCKINGEKNISRLVTIKDYENFGILTSKNWEPPDLNVIDFYLRVSHTTIKDNLNPIFIKYEIDKEMVGVIEILPSENYEAGIYNLSVLKKFRKKGIGTEIMIKALNMLKEAEYKKVWLLTSADGFKIYEKLGFKVNSYFSEFKLNKQ